jgi:hypothetical protein
MLFCAVSASTAATIPQARPRYRVVLGVALGADVVGDPCRVAAHQHIFDQCDGQRFVRLGLVQIGDFGRAVGLGSAAGCFRHEGLHSVPVFGDLVRSRPPDDVEGHHLGRAERLGIAPDIVHEDIVAVLEHSDVFGGGARLLQHLAASR